MKNKLVELLLFVDSNEEESYALLQSVGFRDPATARRNIGLICSDPSLSELAARVIDLALPMLQRLPDPDMALNNWERFLRSVFGKQSHFTFVLSSPQSLETLLRIFSQSQYLSDILIRNPEFANWFFEVESQGRCFESEMTLQELRRSTPAAAALEKKMNLLRRIKRREFLRIGARDVLGLSDFVTSTQELSALASACLQWSYEDAVDEMRLRYGTPHGASPGGEDMEASMVIMGMGKLGGNELNYSSDIDLMFIFAPDGETAFPSGHSGRSVSNTEFFTSVAERVIAYMSRVTSEGQVFRVDMRLRPHGQHGPLASSLESHLIYYQSLGEAWERLALIKARPVAGDLRLGEKFLEQIRPFVYRKSMDYADIDDLQRLKRRMEAITAQEGETATEVKLGRGGIRDVEFIVQFLQLLNGGGTPALRSGNTLEAVVALQVAEILKENEASTLSESYLFFRTVEHRLQIMHHRQLHRLPSDPSELDGLARRLGFVSNEHKTAGELFMDKYTRQTEAVRCIFERFFGSAFKGDGKDTSLSDIILNRDLEADRVDTTLKGCGFCDPKAAYANLMLLGYGPEQRPYHIRVRNAFAQVCALLLREISRTPDPDFTLNNLLQVISAIGAPSTLYEMLRDQPKAIELLVTLSSTSRFLCEKLVRNPGLLDLILQSGFLDRDPTLEELRNEAQATVIEDPQFRRGASRFLDCQTLRIALRDFLNQTNFPTTMRHLCHLADVVTNCALKHCQMQLGQRFGMPMTPSGPAEMCVLGLGKFGGGELNYGSDLDVIFVYSEDGFTSGGHEQKSIANQEYFAKLGSALMEELNSLSTGGVQFKMDARLRPDGNKGPLAVPFQSYREYYQRKCQSWERFALMKVRHVAGGRKLGANCLRLAHEVVFREKIARETIAELEAMRRRIWEHAEARATGQVDIKRGPGGIVQIEFMVQLLQMLNGFGKPELQVGNLLDAIYALQQAEIMSWEESEVISEAYLFLRRTESRLRVVYNLSTNVLPEGEAELDRLAQRLGLTATEDRTASAVFKEQLTAHQQKVIELYCGRILQPMGL